MEEAQTFERPFCDILADAIRFNIFANCNVDSLPIDLIGANCKASILHSVLSIESLANCLVSSLALGKKLHEGVEKMRSVDKINLFLRMNHCDELDFGVEPNQSISQLISVRNDYVHPKALGYKDSVSEEEMLVERESKEYKVLGLPKDPFRWHVNHSTEVLRVVDKFFSHVFIEKLKWEPEQVAFHTQGVIWLGSKYQVTFRKENLDIFLDVKESKNLKLDYMFFPPDGFDNYSVQYKPAEQGIVPNP